MDTIETIIIGAGQAGLAASYYLQNLGREHLLLEKSDHPAHVWSDERWDSFTLNTPNWTVRMPGAEYAGPDPDGFLSRRQVVDYLEQYAVKFNLPIQYGTTVTSVEQVDARPGFSVRTDRGGFQARNVIVATGLFQWPKIPPFASQIPADMLQMSSGQYRSPGALPPGAVLVIGSGQSGCQIAEELYQSGRLVYICVGNAPRMPRRYRGKDIFEWTRMIGFLDRPPEVLPNPRMKFAANPQLSGVNGGHNLNLHQFARDGVRLLGRLSDAHDGCVILDSGLHESLARTDKLEADMLVQLDGFIHRNGLDAPPESLPQLRDGFDQPEIPELDLKTAGIGSVIWCGGYVFDFNLVKLPVTDSDGFPVTTRGVTAYPGLYFIGMPWISKFKSGLLLGVGEDAQYIAEHIASN